MTAPEFERRLQHSIAKGRLTIAGAIGGHQPIAYRAGLLRLIGSAALGLMMAGFSILVVFVVLNLVFHFSMG